MDPLIIFTKVFKSYGKVGAVDVISDFNLTIKQGEFFCLIGPSGCGKSTILKMIAGIEDVSRGDLVKPDKVGMVFQSGALLPWLTVEDNVAFAARMQGFSEEKTKRVTNEYLKMVKLDGFRTRYPRELSGGQRQRVGIARALTVESEVLLLDEPFSALDPLTSEELRNDLLTIWLSTKKTVVMISHLLEEAVLLAERIGIMKDGRLKTIISINLPRPRSEEEKKFLTEVERTRKILEQ